MKWQVLLFSLLFCFVSDAQLAIYVGVRGDAGIALTKDKLSPLGTTQGSVNLVQNNKLWSTSGKGEFLIGFGRLRVGYQFMYNYSPAQTNSYSNVTSIDEKSATTYFSSSNTQLFAHYFVIELAVFRKKKFSLVPGFLVGGFSGFTVDNATKQKVQLSAETYKHATVGAVLNGEIKVKRVTFLFSPSYNLFKMKDKVNTGWTETRQFIGGDIGLRVNLRKAT